jgi:hypothetical protein
MLIFKIHQGNATLERASTRARVGHSISCRYVDETKKLELCADHRFLAPLGMTFIPPWTKLLVFLAAVSLMLPALTFSQPGPSRSAIKVVLVSGGTNGLSAGEADSFFSNFQGKLSQFPGLSVLLKADFAKGLSREDKAVLDKCVDVGCVQSLAGKAGFQRVLLCRVAKKNSSYQFQSDEFDVKKPQKISEITDNAVCTSAEEIDSFVKKAAIRVGQSITHETSAPESLQESKSNLWWYIGSAAVVGAAAGVYFIVEHKKQNSSTPSSLPLPPNFP